MGEQFTTEAIVLKQFDLGEADKIITLYSKDRGKIRAVAKGVRKSKSSISGLVLPFSYNQVTIYQGRSIARINQLENIFSFSALREDLLNMAYASFMAEFIEKVGMENDPNEHLFSLLLTSFYQLMKRDETSKYIDLLFKVKLLILLGFKPQLAECTNCNSIVKADYQNTFVIKEGGLVCKNCVNLYPEYIVLNGEAIQVLRQLFSAGMKSIKNLKISQNAAESINNLIDKFVLYHLDFRLKSLEFLNMIKKMG